MSLTVKKKPSPGNHRGKVTRVTGKEIDSGNYLELKLGDLDCKETSPFQRPLKRHEASPEPHRSVQRKHHGGALSNERDARRTVNQIPSTPMNSKSPRQSNRQA